VSFARNREAVYGTLTQFSQGYETELFASFDGFFKEGSRHIMLSGYEVVEINEKYVKLNKPAPAPFDSDTISLEAGVISTGSKYSIPMRPTSSSLKESQEGLQRLQKEVAKAEHIMIVGGGAVGLEFAGEVLDEHPGKKITLVEMQGKLLPPYREALGKSLERQLKDMGVDLRMKTGLDLKKEHFENSQKLVPEKMTIKLDDGSEVKTDFLFIASGGAPNTDIVPEDALDDGKPKRIDVDDKTLRLKHASLGKTWFALGDVNNLKVQKTHVNTVADAPVVAAQVVGLLNGKGSNKTHREPYDVMMIPIGASKGASQIIYPVVGEWVTSIFKGKGLFTSQFMKSYPGGKASAV
jgi:pyruvate/2-oxoglutarate dehydrogenase complex dihydrolipoamide dehydrogenase (E3) component